MAFNPNSSLPIGTVNISNVGHNFSSFSSQESILLLNKVHADVQLLTATMKTVQAELHALKQNDNQRSHSFETETIADIERRLNNTPSDSDLIEFMTKRSPALHAVLGQLKTATLTDGNNTACVSSDLYSNLKDIVDGILNYPNNTSLAKEARSKFLKLADYIAKEAALFDQEFPSTRSGPLYGDKIRLLSARTHQFLFRGISLFKLSDGTAFSVTPSGKLLVHHDHLVIMTCHSCASALHRVIWDMYWNRKKSKQSYKVRKEKDPEWKKEKKPSVKEIGDATPSAGMFINAKIPCS